MDSDICSRDYDALDLRVLLVCLDLDPYNPAVCLGRDHGRDPDHGLDPYHEVGVVALLLHARWV